VHRVIRLDSLAVVDCLLCLWSWGHQTLTSEYFPCVHDMIKAFRAETSVESVIPHFQLCPLSAHRAMPESSISGFADGIFHIKLSLSSPCPDCHGHPATERVHKGLHGLTGFCQLSEARDFLVTSYQDDQLSFAFAPHGLFSIISRVNEPIKSISDARLRTSHAIH
jgi:hypothetical protein